MAEFTREDIEKHLNKLPVSLRAAFAARAAASALVFLDDGGDEFLSCWKRDDKAQHLLAVLRAVQIAFLVNLNGRFFAPPPNSITSVSQSLVDIVDPDADVAAYAAASVVSAAKVFTAASAVSSIICTDAADYAVRAANHRGLNLSFRLRIELWRLKGNESTQDYLSRPLPLAYSGADILIVLRHVIGEKSNPIGKAIYQAFISRLRQFGSGFDYWADWYQDRLAGKPINWDHLVKAVLLDESLLSQGPAAVNAYLKSLTEGKAERPLNRVRAIFIGYGAAGKTSLIRALHGEAVQEGKEDMTPGIAIREWPVPDTEIKAHCWDFGGQVMAHATHKFFLRERCVYVLVLDGRADINANQQAEYWLEHVRVFGGDSLVLLVGNKADQVHVSLDMNSLTERYPYIVGFYPLSCTQYQGTYRHHFEIFRDALSQQLTAIGTHQILFTAGHFAVLEALRQRAPRESFLKKQDYDALCEQHQVEVSGGLDRAWLLDLLDKLGLVVYFPKIETLDEYVLNPRWLTYGVYTLLYSKAAKDGKGRIIKSQAVDVLQAAAVKDELDNALDYPPGKCGFVLEAMEQFEICYRLPNARDVFILPDLLPSDRPEHLDFDKAKALAFDFDFEGLLPRHLMTVFIVRKHADIVDNLVWQNGVRLAAKAFQAQALVQADYHRRRLSLWIEGPDASRYFSSLYEEFKSMLALMPKLRYQEWVSLPKSPGWRDTDDSPRASFRQLLALERAGQSVYIDEHGTFKLSEVLKIMSKEEREKQSREIHFHGSGSVIYQENGTMTDVTMGDKTVMLAQAKELHKKLGDIEYDLGVQVEDETLRNQALRELQMIRQALQTLENGTQEQREGALEALSRFGDKAKEGAGKTVEALKSIQEGGEAVGWLMQRFRVLLNFWHVGPAESTPTLRHA